MKAKTKEKLKETLRRTKVAAKLTGEMIGKVGKRVHKFSEATSREAFEAVEVHPSREDHYLDLTGKRPKKVPSRGRFDWGNLGVRF